MKKEDNKFPIRLDSIMTVEAPNGDGYTACIESPINVIAEGNTECMAVNNLFNAINDIYFLEDKRN